MSNDENDDVPLAQKNDIYSNSFADVLYGKSNSQVSNAGQVRDMTGFDMVYYHQLASRERSKAFHQWARQFFAFLKRHLWPRPNRKQSDKQGAYNSILELKIKGRLVFAI